VPVGPQPIGLLAASAGNSRTQDRRRVTAFTRYGSRGLRGAVLSLWLGKATAYGRAVKHGPPKAKAWISRALGPLRKISDARGLTVSVIAAVMTLVLAAGCGSTTAARRPSTHLAPGAGWVIGRVGFGPRYTGAVLTVFRCVRRARPDLSGDDACPGGDHPQQVMSKQVDPGDDQLRFQLRPGRYTIEAQPTKHSNPFGCISSYEASVRANHPTHLAPNLLPTVDGRCDGS
jgi:hypothetical protein